MDLESKRENGKKSFVFFLILFFLSSTVAVAEQFRVHKSVSLPISRSGSKNTVYAGVNDCLVIELPSDMEFIEGVELQFKVPKEVAAWRDSVAYSFYDGITPEPSSSIIDYNGIRRTTGTFGSSLSATIKIPLKRNHSIKKDAYSTLLGSVPEVVNGKIFLRLQLAMKGTSDDIYSAMFQVSGKPLFINKGKLFVQPIAPDKGEVKPYTVFIDGTQTDVSGGVLLTPGLHNVNIVSEHYRNEFRTVTVEQAKRHTVNVELMSIEPMVRIAAPEGTLVFLDDVHVPNISNPLFVTQGEHQIRFVIGDYEMVRSISALKGRTYNVNISISATVTEEE
ncbi:MAG: hypothetical protein IKI90_06125 [Treponema sp.]|nr:hypothetical protein [Treponema sp.]